LEQATASRRFGVKRRWQAAQRLAFAGRRWPGWGTLLRTATAIPIFGARFLFDSLVFQIGDCC
jgi:hypothetical protein